MELEPVEIQNAKMYLGWPIFRKQKGFLNLPDIFFRTESILSKTSKNLSLSLVFTFII